MNIHSAQVTDFEAIAALSRACFGASALRAESLAAMAEHGILLLADAPAEPCAGYLAIQIAADEAELQSLAVAAGWRRAGIGAALLQAGLRQAGRRGARQIYLEVREGNAAAIAFYHHHGFAACGRRPGYYQEPPDAAVLMRLDLGSV